MFTRYQKVVCADGFSMSVQAHNGAYCTPRENGAHVYTEVEVGFPNREESMLMDYAEEKGNPTGTVYAYVPVQVVTNVIAKHGGTIEGEVPPGVALLRASTR